MTDPTKSHVASTRLHSAVVLRVREGDCDVLSGGRLSRARYATLVPSPRVERVSPGHLVALSAAPDGSDVVVWRWYDAVVLGAEADLLRMWEPAHGEVLARQRVPHQHPQIGTRAYLPAGLPGAEWWVAASVTANAERAAVELAEVDRLYTDNDLWHCVV